MPSSPITCSSIQTVFFMALSFINDGRSLLRPPSRLRRRRRRAVRHAEGPPVRAVRGVLPAGGLPFAGDIHVVTEAADVPHLGDAGHRSPSGVEAAQADG